MSSAQYEPNAAQPLDELDLALLVSLAEHKILSTYKMMVLFFDSLRTAQKRIKGLKDEGLIYTFAWRNRRTQRDSDRHVLSSRGAALICELQGRTRAQLGWIPADEAEARKRLWHISGANAFFCELVEATLHTEDVGPEFTEIFEPLFARPSSNKKLKVEVNGLEPSASALRTRTPWVLIASRLFALVALTSEETSQ